MDTDAESHLQDAEDQLIASRKTDRDKQSIEHLENAVGSLLNAIGIAQPNPDWDAIYHTEDPAGDGESQGAEDDAEEGGGDQADDAGDDEGGDADEDE